MIIIFLLLCIFVILWCHYRIHRGKFWQLIDQIPGKSPLLLFGNTFVWCITLLEDTLHNMENYIKTYYPIAKAWSFHLAFVAASHPDDVKTILSNSKTINKGFMYTFLHPWLGTGLITSEGTKWHTRRKILTSTFYFNILKQYANILIEEGNYMAQRLKDSKDLIINDLFSFTSYHTLNAICETAMGTSLKDMGEFQQQYRKTVHEINQIITARSTKPWFYPDVIFALLPLGRRQAKNLRILHGFTEKIIAERKEYHNSTDGKYLKQFGNNSLTDEETLGMGKKRLAMLDFLIAASRNNKMSDLNIREEVDTSMFAGHDAIALSLCFMISLLAEHKNN